MRTNYACPDLLVNERFTLKSSVPRLDAVQQWHARKFTAESTMLGYRLSTRCVARESPIHEPKSAISIARRTESRSSPNS